VDRAEDLRLLILHTGGTLMMRREPEKALSPDVYTQNILDEVPVLRSIGHIETKILFNLDSADLQPHHWVELAREVHVALGEFDGVIVIHGTDTMAYTASALAFLLPGLDRSVVLTGSQSPLGDMRTDARANLVNACHVASFRIPEVGIAFSNKLFRGCRATKVDAWSNDAFGSPSCPPLAELGLGVHVGRHALAPRPPDPFDPRIEDRVLAVRTFPGLDPKLLLGALDSGVRGLVVEAYGCGTVARVERSLIPVIEAARRRDVPVVMVSQCLRGAVDLTRYQGGVEAADAGAIGAGDMTPEAALTKLMVFLGRASQGGRLKAAREAFATSLVGEMG
jgi:L-asparaginase